MGGVRGLVGTPIVLRRTALASLIANIAIVVTGGAVRLTGSGLGCPTWPSCTDSSYVTTPAMGIYGVIEFTNRMLGIVVGVVALVVVVSAALQTPRRRRVVTLAAWVLAGIPAQAVLGGITVLTDLNPWVVACHFLLSMGVITAAYATWRALDEGDGPAELAVPRQARTLSQVILGVCLAVLAVGTIVTGSGPHAGDEKAHRTGLSPAAVAQVHADLVFLLFGLTVAAWLLMGAVGASVVRRRVAWLIAIIAGQGLIGFVQYFTRLPAALVGAHMLGACLVLVGALNVLWATRTRAVTQPADTQPADTDDSQDATREKPADPDQPTREAMARANR